MLDGDKGIWSDVDAFGIEDGSDGLVAVDGGGLAVGDDLHVAGGVEQNAAAELVVDVRDVDADLRGFLVVLMEVLFELRRGVRIGPVRHDVAVDVEHDLVRLADADDVVIGQPVAGLGLGLVVAPDGDVLLFEELRQAGSVRCHLLRLAVHLQGDALALVDDETGAARSQRRACGDDDPPHPASRETPWCPSGFAHIRLSPSVSYHIQTHVGVRIWPVLSQKTVLIIFTTSSHKEQTPRRGSEWQGRKRQTFAVIVIADACPRKSGGSLKRAYRGLSREKGLA